MRVDVLVTETTNPGMTRHNLSSLKKALENAQLAIYHDRAHQYAQAQKHYRIAIVLIETVMNDIKLEIKTRVALSLKLYFFSKRHTHIVFYNRMKHACLVYEEKTKHLHHRSR